MMEKGKWLIMSVAAICMLASCRPRGVLSPREMEDLLVDMHRCEGVMSVVGYDLSSSDTEQKFFAVLLDKRGVTQAQFDSSLVWYTHHPKRFDKIYPRVCERLKAEKELLEAEMSNTELQGAEPKKEAVPLRPLKEVMDEGMYGYKCLFWQENEDFLKKKS